MAMTSETRKIRKWFRKQKSKIPSVSAQWVEKFLGQAAGRDLVKLLVRKNELERLMLAQGNRRHRIGRRVAKISEA